MKWPLVAWGRCWVRICGYGVRYVDHRKQRATFSERYGPRRAIHVGPHCFAWVTP